MVKNSGQTGPTGILTPGHPQLTQDQADQYPNVETYSAIIPIGLPLKLTIQGNCFVLKSATGSITGKIAGTSSNFEVPLGRVFRFDSPFGIPTILELTSSAGVADSIKFDFLYGLEIPLDMMPGAGSGNPASVVASTAEVFTGTATGTPFTATFKFECPFVHMELSGTWTGATIVLNYPDGTTGGPILYDAFGTIIAKPQPALGGGGVTATNIPNSTASNLVLMMDATGASSCTITRGTGTVNVFMTAAHTTNSNLNNENQETSQYRAASVSYAVAATATDIWTMAPSTTRNIRLLRLRVYLLQSAAPNDIQFVQRSTLDTGGTATTLTNVPLDSRDPASTATVKTYTANPATIGTLIGSEEGFRSSATTIVLWELDFRQNQRRPTLQANSTQMFAISNGGAAGLNGSSLSVTAEWEEYN